MFKNLRRTSKKGFTLIELIIVIAIIAILAAIAVPAFGQIRERSTVSADIGSARTIYSVATAELASNNIALGTGAVTSTDTDATGTESENLETFTLVDGKKLGDFIDPTPKVQAYQNAEFTVSVDNMGNVQIYVASTTNGTAVDNGDNYIQIYPKAEGKYLGQQADNQ